MRGMNKIKHTIYTILLAGLLMAEAVGCQRADQTRTITLPPLADADPDSETIQIGRILEYNSDGPIESMIYPGIGMKGDNVIYLLTRDMANDTSQCLKVDMEQERILDDIYVEEGNVSIFNAFFAPGGQYLAYERIMEEQGLNQLVLFSVENQGMQFFWETRETNEVYQYAWSDDGTCLFTWQDGAGYDPYQDWQITRYKINEQPDKTLRVDKTQFNLEGRGAAVRSVLPSADGSEVYVREDFELLMSGRALDMMAQNKDSSAAAGSGASTGGTSTDSDMDINDVIPPANNWLIDMDEMIMSSLPEYFKGTASPIKYTQAGLFVQEEGGLLCLIGDIGGQATRTELFQTEGMEVCVCGKGDHVFLAEWITPGTYQISGARILEGEAFGRKILYRGTQDSVERLSVEGDHMIVFHSLEYAEPRGHYFLKIVSLEY